MVSIRGKEWFADGPLVSVVVPTFNSEETLGLCLQSIRNQTYPNTETIVVDRYSKDGTLKVAEAFNVKILRRGPERSAQKNWGAANADGSFILFLDSDMELTPKVVKECVAACLQGGADAVIIPQVSVAEGFLAECRKIERESYIGDRFIEAPRFFKKEIFNYIGGFDEKLTFGEDSYLYARMEQAGYKTLRVQSKIRHYEGDLSIKEIILKAYYYGKTLLIFVKKHPSLVIKKYSPIRQAYIRNAKLLFKDPIHFIGLILMKLVEYEAYLIGTFAYLLVLVR